MRCLETQKVTFSFVKTWQLAELQMLRLGFDPFTPADALTLTKLLSFGLSTNWERELLRAEMTRELGAELAARLDPPYPRGNPAVLTPGRPWEGDGLGRDWPGGTTAQAIHGHQRRRRRRPVQLL